jgi:uncharacterized protein (DUF2252 family)
MMVNRNISDRIQKFNKSQPRDPDLLKAKYAAMRATEENPFVFFRATCHLFYEDLPIKSWFKKAPLAWICGDLHIENFGNYKADNRHVYFDVNDFDEAILAPVTWEIARLLTSIFVAAETFKIEKPFAETLCQHFLDAYSKAIADGKAYWMGEDTAPPVIEDLLSRKTQVKRKELLDQRTVLDKNRQKRSLKIDNKKAQEISEAQKQKIQDFMKDFAAKQSNPEFFKLIDVAQRIAGKGSLGVERYVLLVEGNGSPDGNYLLDLKKALPSALAPSMSRDGIWEQPKWSSEADRIVTVHRRSQAMPIAFLQAVTIGSDSFVMRGLQSTQSPTDHLKIEKWDDKVEESEQLIQSLGNIVAWAHLRSSGHQGSAIADQLIEFASKSKWKTEVMEYAKIYSQQVSQDWQEFYNSSS